MIWASVSFRSCFCRLYRASPSLATKNVISLILVLTIWWCPCVKSSLVLLKNGVCHDQCILLAQLLAFVLLHFVFQGQTCLLLQITPDFLLLYSSPLWWQRHLFFFFLVLVPKGPVDLHRTVKLHFSLALQQQRRKREKRQKRSFIDSLPSARSFMSYLLLLWVHQCWHHYPHFIGEKSIIHPTCNIQKSEVWPFHISCYPFWK